MPDPGAHVPIKEWGDIDLSPSVVSGEDKDCVAQLLRETDWKTVVWVPAWMIENDDKSIGTVEVPKNLVVGQCNDYSEAAWRLYQPHLEDAGEYLPKSQVVVFEVEGALGDLDSPQQGLSDFAP